MVKFNPLEASLKAVALGGIFMFWANLSRKAFNFCWHIFSTSPGEETYKASFKIMCGNCRELYDDDEEHVINGSFLCEACR